MLKKIFCAAFLCAAIIFVGNAKVSAQDVWIHTDGKSGTDYYVMTETLTTDYIPNRHTGHLNFEGYVKYVRNGSLLAKKKFHVYEGEAAFSYRIDDSKEIWYPPLSSIEGTIAHKVCNYCHKHFKVGDYFRMGGD